MIFLFIMQSIIDSPKTTLDISASGQQSNNNVRSIRENEILLLASLINGEAHDEPYIGQVAVGAVILNRVKHPDFPNTVYGVIYQDNAFKGIMDGQINTTPPQSCLNAARDVINGWDPVDGAVYCCNSKAAEDEFIKSLTMVKTIGNYKFYNF